LHIDGEQRKFNREKAKGDIVQNSGIDP